MDWAPVKVGVIGCGNISGRYLGNAKTFAAIEIAGVADLIPEKAITKAVDFGVPQANTADELLANPDIEVVLNLTTPAAHTGITLAALHAGKSVYKEKPFAISREDGQRILDAARDNNLRVGCAPDTFLGAGYQTARRLLDDGAIGEPVAATAFMTGHGHEHWHPNPEFYYQVGGGPLFDMGPYYLTALVHLLGPVRRVCASTRITFPERTITSQPKHGKKIKVETPTHVAGVLDFDCGVVCTLIMSFDVWHANLPFVEVYGASGSLSLPDPNTFGGPVRLRQAEEADWREMPLTFPYEQDNRGIGLADMAHALRTGRSHRANAELGYHVLDVMHALHESSDMERHVDLGSRCAQPAPIVPDLTPGMLDD